MSYIDPTIGWLEIGSESTYGTEATELTPVLLDSQPDFGEELSKIIQDVWKPSGAKLPHEMIDDHVSLSFTVQLSPLDFSDGATPDVAPILKAAGFEETTGGTTTSGPVTATYSRSRPQTSSMTVKWYMYDPDNDTWLAHTITGVRCAIAFTCELESYAMLEVSDAQGLYSEIQAPSTTPSPPAASDYVSGELLVQDTTTSFGSVGSDVSAFSIDMGVGLHQRRDQTGTKIVEEIYATHDDPAAGSFDPRVKEASFNSGGVWPDARDSETRSYSYEIDRSGDVLRFSGDQAQLDPPSVSAADEYLRHDLTFEAAESYPGANDDVQIEWEAAS